MNPGAPHHLFVGSPKADLGQPRTREPVHLPQDPQLDGSRYHLAQLPQHALRGRDSCVVDVNAFDEGAQNAGLPLPRVRRGSDSCDPDDRLWEDVSAHILLLYAATLEGHALHRMGGSTCSRVSVIFVITGLASLELSLTLTMETHIGCVSYRSRSTKHR